MRGNLMNTPVIQVIEASKSFRTTRAVDGVSFDVHRGEILALLGPNGAGKTTMVRMMIGMLLPDQGSIQWYADSGDRSVLDVSQIGYLPEERGLYADQKVGRILQYFGELNGLTTAQARQSIQEWSDKLAISEYLPRKLSTLSKGNQQKVQVAATVLHRPRVLFLDEPFSGLDPINQEMMLDNIRTLRSRGTTIVLSGHQLELVERLADRVILLHKGKRILAGTIPEIKSTDYSGFVVRVRFAERINPLAIESWRNQDPLLAINLIEENGLEFILRHQSDALQWLEKSFGSAEVVDLHGGYLSLREIYLRAINHKNEADRYVNS
jgi:ABC-2 type transport system ATP-binding protein